MQRRDPFLIEGPALISFSGGRTSGFMLRRILDAGLQPDVKVVFADTGKERPETYDFVRAVEKQWQVPIQWVYREGYFDQLIVDKKALPNTVQRFCTQHLKLYPMWKFGKAQGWEHWTACVGIRADEPRRWTKIRNRKPEKFESIEMPLVDAGIALAEVTAFWQQQPFDLQLQPHEGNCDLCLAAETEIVTRDGIRAIGSLVGERPELLVPKWANGSLSEIGAFVAAPVRSFGRHQLWKIELAGHGRSTKTVFATAEHRWFLKDRRHLGVGNLPPVETQNLQQGDRLRNLFRCPIGEKRGGASRLGAMRGFVFGDGTVRSGSRPGCLTIYEGKDEVFLRLFESCCGNATEGTNPNGTRRWSFYGLPDYWKKEYPSLRESRHYLMGWLAGWFAADGCVATNGACVLSAAQKDHLEFARSVCAVLGIQTSPATGVVRDVVLPDGHSMAGHALYGIRLNRFHLTADFFWLDHHRERVTANASKEERRYGWTVKAVEQTDRIEEVFCATVDGVGAFGLADGLMTGNCMLKGQQKRLRIMQDHPELARWWIEQEEKTGRFFRAPPRPSYRDLFQLSQQPRLFEPEAEEVDDLIDCMCTD